MEQHELAEMLAKLHTELSKSDQVDPATLDSLRALTADVNRLLGQSDATAAAAAEVEPVARGLKDWLLGVEAEHPQLSDRLGRVADALAAMGI